MRVGETLRSAVKFSGYGWTLGVQPTNQLLFNLAVGGFPAKSAILDNNLTPVDVIAKAVAAEGKSPLAFASRNAHKLLDVVDLTAVARIGFEDTEGAVQQCVELRMAPKEISSQPLEAWSCADRERDTHVLPRRFVLLRAPCRSSWRNSSAGRLLPARYSWLLFRMCSRTFGSRSSR